MTGVEIAEKIQLPPALSRAWHCRGFYGSVSHNVKVCIPVPSFSLGERKRVDEGLVKRASIKNT